MKNILIISIILLLSSCSINNNEELNNKISKLEEEKQELVDKIKKVETDKLFEKKQECASYKKQIENIWTEEIKQLSLITWHWYKYEIWEIFYSTSLNTCIYTLEFYKYMDTVINNKYIKYLPLNKYAYDYLTSKELIWTTWWVTEEDFYLKLEKLR